MAVSREAYAFGGPLTRPQPWALRLEPFLYFLLSLSGKEKKGSTARSAFIRVSLGLLLVAYFLFRFFDQQTKEI